MHPVIANSLVGLVALLLNIPFGYKRVAHAPRSAAWLLWVHASIPVIIALRYLLDTSPQMIPANIAAAVIGQMIGGQIKKRAGIRRAPKPKI